MTMTVITMTNCPPKLRGDLTKWLFEINTGVYVGNISARVRDGLWDRICENIGSGQATMVYSSANEQHLEFKTHNSSWKVRDLDGIKLMMQPNKAGSDGKELPKGFSNASKYLMASRRRRKTSETESRWVFIDIETTGLDVKNDRIIEIAALEADKTQVYLKWSRLINIGRSPPPQITELTGITDEMLCGGTEAADTFKQFSQIIKDKTLVSFNRKFDISFLENEYRRNNLEFSSGRVIDALYLARKRIVGLENFKLVSIADYFNIPHENDHRALSDCETLYKVFLKLNEI